MTPEVKTVRVLLGHGSGVAPVGFPLLAAIDAYGYERRSLRGGVNSWYVVSPRRYLRGDAQTGEVEVRKTERGPVHLVLNRGAQAERWVRNGLPL